MERQIESGKVMVAIVETSVLEVKAYHCRCLSCEWRSRRYDRESWAVTLAKRHVCKKVKE